MQFTTRCIIEDLTEKQTLPSSCFILDDAMNHDISFLCIKLRLSPSSNQSSTTLVLFK